jgi:hypothetical protein
MKNQDIYILERQKTLKHRISSRVRMKDHFKMDHLIDCLSMLGLCLLVGVLLAI